MILTEFVPPCRHILWDLTAQMGIRHVIVKCAPELSGRNPPWDIDALAAIQSDLAEAGLTLHGLEGDEFDMSRIKLGLPGRDEDLELYCRMLRNMGELGVPLLCYNFMAQRGWTRSLELEPIRGGALATRFRLADMPQGGETVPAERIWGNYLYFLQAVLPAAEKSGVKMGLHPDDPPLPELCGVGRIFGTTKAFDRALAVAPESPSHGITFCQANFKLMGADLAATFSGWARRGKIHFLHVRDVRGTAADFTELFHDESEVDQPALFDAYHTAGFRGPVRCDHVPTLAGESPEVAGYGTLGRLLAIGYFKGILQALRIPYQ